MHRECTGQELFGLEKDGSGTVSQRKGATGTGALYALTVSGAYLGRQGHSWSGAFTLSCCMTSGEIANMGNNGPYPLGLLGI